MATDVRDAPSHNRYEATVDGTRAAEAYYRDVDRVRVFTHTEVEPEHEGQGVGSALVRAALDDVRASGRSLVAVCPFVRGYIERHPEYADLVDGKLDAQLRG